MAVSTVASPASFLSLSSTVDLLHSLHPSLVGVGLAGREPEELGWLMEAVRAGQRALDALTMRIALAAEELAAGGRGRGAHGVLLGEGGSVRGRDARREVDRASALSELDQVAAAVNCGWIGGAQVDVFARALRSVGVDERAELNTEELVAAAASEPVDTFARRVRRVVETIKGDGGLGDARAQRDQSSWRSWIDRETGMGHVHGEFDPVRFEEIGNAIENHLTRLANQGGVSKSANLAATAAHELLTGRATGGAGVPLVSVVVDGDTFVGRHRPHGGVRETAAGQPVPSETVARLACDAMVQRIVLDDRGVPINVGRRYRTATDAQWAAARAVHRSCAWNGCQRPLTWCQLHHIHEWKHGGSTDLCNLVPLCNEHHHAVHEGGWSLRMASDRTLDGFSPDGVHQFRTRPDRMAGSGTRPRAGPPPST